MSLDREELRNVFMSGTIAEVRKGVNDARTRHCGRRRHNSASERCSSTKKAAAAASMPHPGPRLRVHGWWRFPMFTGFFGQSRRRAVAMGLASMLSANDAASTTHPTVHENKKRLVRRIPGHGSVTSQCICCSGGPSGGEPKVQFDQQARQNATFGKIVSADDARERSADQSIISAFRDFD